MEFLHKVFMQTQCIWLVFGIQLDKGRNGGAYSLEVLSGDEKVMDGYANHLDEEDGHAAAGKKSMKDLFGKANLKKMEHQES